MCAAVRVQYQVWLWHFNENWIFCRVFFENLRTSSFMKIRQVGSESSHADGWAW